MVKLIKSTDNHIEECEERINLLKQSQPKQPRTTIPQSERKIKINQDYIINDFVSKADFEPSIVENSVS